MNANDIVSVKPRGYRWATEVEVERMTHPAYFSRMVQVRVSHENVVSLRTYLAIKVS